MKNILFTVLITFLVLPAFTPWIPHESIHALYKHQTEHHGAKKTHDINTQTSNDHPINFDAVTYFSDFLHVDLKKSSQFILNVSAPNLQDIDFTVVAIIKSHNIYKLASAQSRAPPDWSRLRPENIPPYRSTQRLRI